MRVVNTTEYAELEESGDYHLLFGRTWGAPYDPHSYMSSWKEPSHFEHKATLGMTEPLTQDRMLTLIEEAQRETDTNVLAAKWREVHAGVHAQALFFPLWGTRNPSVINRRLFGFQPSSQAYSYPLETVQIAAGSDIVTAAPAFGDTLFTSTGPIHPHHYSPNNMNAQAWVYEGLVGYGQDGEITPVLATSWKKDTTSSGGERYTFTLRENVVFHDGSAWNCSVAKLNFDHILEGAVKTRHDWMPSIDVMESWNCNAAGQFEIVTKEPYSPLLQELSYIRPFTFASAASFANGLDTDPVTQNGCMGFQGRHEAIEESITCAGLSAPIGTGVFKFMNRTKKTAINGDEVDGEVVFARNDDHWGPQTGIRLLKVVHYETTQEVESALLSDELDMALGLGSLTAKQVFKFKSEHSDRFDVRHTDVLQHALLVFNSNRVPTNDIRVRQAIIHAIDKNKFIEDEFSSLEQPVGQLLPYNAPYCNVYLNPKWSYDLDKALLLNCPDPASISNSSSDGLSSGAIGGIVVAAVVASGMVAFVVFLVSKERSGQPVFAPEKVKHAEEA